MSEIVSCICSSEYPGHPCRNAIDGDKNTIWNSGGFAPQFIEVLLDAPVNQLELGFVPEMSPAFGDLKIEFILINNKGNELNRYENIFPCKTGVLEKIKLRSKKIEENDNSDFYKISKIRVNFLGSPSWIALREIRTY